MKRERALYAIGILLVVAILATSVTGFLLYQKLSDLEQQQQSDRANLELANQVLGEQMQQQATIFSEFLLELRNDVGNLGETLDNNTRVLSANIEVLDGNIRALNREFDNVVSDFDSLSLKVDTVELQSQEQLQRLQSDIRNLGQDFTFISDLYPSVVSIRTGSTQGSGFAIRADGYIATSYHVIRDAEDIEVVLWNGEILPAALVGYSPPYDIAVLKVSRTFTPLKFASKSSVVPGQRIVAVGNPLGLSLTVTEGVVSAVNRKFEGSPVSWVQTDTPINPGNSGGPLINADERVTGIATAMISGSTGLGFAVPGHEADDIINQIIAGG